MFRFLQRIVGHPDDAPKSSRSKEEEDEEALDMHLAELDAKMAELDGLQKKLEEVRSASQARSKVARETHEEFKKTLSRRSDLLTMVRNEGEDGRGFDFREKLPSGTG